MAISGTVIYIPSTVDGSLPFGGSFANVWDNNLATDATYDPAKFHFAAAIQPTAYAISPRSVSGGSDYSKQSMNYKLYYSTDDSTYTLALTGTTAFLQNVIEQRSLTAPIAAAHWRFTMFAVNTADPYLSASEVRFIGPYNASVACRACAPVVDVTPGRFTSAQTVSLSCVTGGVTIYYTTDGSTPSAGSTAYTGPITVSTSQTIKAIAIGSGATSSDVASFSYVISANWYDNTSGVYILDNYNQRLEAHAGTIRKFGNYWYRYGFPFRCSGADNLGQDFAPGIVCYRSLSFNGPWEYRGIVYNSAATRPGFILRSDVIYNASTSKYVLIGNDCFNAGYTPMLATFATCDTPDGTFVAQNYRAAVDGIQSGNSYEFKDMSLFQDDDGTAYAIYNFQLNGAANTLRISRLTSDYLNTTNAPKTVENTAAAAGREAPQMFKRGSTYFLITSVGNFYDNASTFDLKYQTATSPYGTWSTATSLWASDPVGTQLNVQSGPVRAIPGYLDGQGYPALLMVGDYWGKTAMYDSRILHFPLLFSSPTAFQAQPDVTWKPSDRFNPGQRAGTVVSFNGSSSTMNDCPNVNPFNAGTVVTFSGSASTIS